MTTIRGSQWKTSWNRRRNYGIQGVQPQSMWFFNLRESPDVWRYIAPLASPFPLADAPPFWFGYVWKGNQQDAGMRYGQHPVEATGIRGHGVSIVHGVGPTIPPSQDPASIGRIEAGGDVVPALNNDTVDVEYLLGQVVVVAVTVEALPDSEVRVRQYANRLFIGQATYAGPYDPQVNPFFFDQLGTPNSPCVHGFVAGPGTPTGAQLARWFDDTKVNLEIAEIAGMTSDRWSATSAQPNVPDPLPNLSTGQDLTLTSIGAPLAPSNTQISAYFSY